MEESEIPARKKIKLEIPLRSSAWEYFDRIDKSTAKCTLCKRSLKTSRGSTSGLIKHLSSIHQIKLDEDDEEEETAFSSTEEAVSKLVALDGLSFNTIAKSKVLHQLFQGYGLRNLPTSPSGVRDCVIKYAESKREKHRKKFKELTENGEKVSVTLDEWTSCAKRRYMNVNIHGINGKCWNLGLSRIQGSLTAEFALDMLKLKLAEFGLDLEKHIVAVVTDGASNMKKLGKLSNVNHQLCFVHGIHLAITDVFYKRPLPNKMSASIEEVGINVNPNPSVEQEQHDSATMEEDPDDINLVEEENSTFIVESPEALELEVDLKVVVDRVRNVVKLFSNSPLKTESLHKQMRDAKKKEITVGLDCKTRWNSLFDMLEVFHRYNPEIQKALIDVKEAGMISDADFLIIEDLVSVLAPVKVAVEKMCRRDATLITCEVAIDFILKKVSSCNSKYKNKLMNAISTRVQERRNELTEAILYLNSNVSSVQPKKSKRGATCDKNRIAEKIKFLYTPSCTALESQEPENSEDDMDETFMGSPLQTFLENELNQLINEATTSAKKMETSTSSVISSVRKEMASFENGGGRGKILETVFKHLLTVPPSTVEAERAFSCATHFCTKIRSRMADATLDALVFLKYYFLHRDSSSII